MKKIPTKITDFYYLHYPDKPPEDSINAGSEVYVEVGGEESTSDDFWYTYSFFVATPKYIEENFFKKGTPFFYERSVIIVKEFTDSIIKKALEEILPEIDWYGVSKDAPEESSK